MRTLAPYKGTLTREQFLYYEMRTTARLLAEGKSDAEAVEEIVSENLFQKPTEKMLRNIATVCLARLHDLSDDALISAIAHRPMDVGKQICVYAMMRHYRIVWEFMISVIGEKFRTKDMAFSRADVKIFMTRLQEQDETVASWSASTVSKIEQVIMRMLIEAEYLDDAAAGKLNPVLLDLQLEATIRANNDQQALLAFNCFM